MNGPLAALAVAIALTAPGVALAQTPDASGPTITTSPEAVTSTDAPLLRDPWEGWNRRVFAFNNVIDRAALEPVARGYRALTPRFARTGVSNALSNLRSPVTFANDVLQGDLGRAATTAGRFGINSTVGVVGLFDVATAVGLDRHEEDFGQTLGVWGVKPGIYLMLPLVGPSTTRDFTGSIVDVGFHPLTYLGGEDANAVRGGLAALGAISAREAAIESIDALRRTSADPYVTIRSVYGQARASAVRNGVQDVQDLPDFGGPTN